jgi:hypothetical protein
VTKFNRAWSRFDRFADDRFIRIEWSRSLDDGINKHIAHIARMVFSFGGKFVHGKPDTNRQTSGPMKALFCLHAIIICRSMMYNGRLKNGGLSKLRAAPTSSHVSLKIRISL